MDFVKTCLIKLSHVEASYRDGRIFLPMWPHFVEHIVTFFRSLLSGDWLIDWLIVRLGGHARARIVMHESEAPAALHKEDDETVFPRCRMQERRWTRSDPGRGSSAPFCHSFPPTWKIREGGMSGESHRIFLMVRKKWRAISIVQAV